MKSKLSTFVPLFILTAVAVFFLSGCDINQSNSDKSILSDIPLINKTHQVFLGLDKLDPIRSNIKEKIQQDPRQYVLTDKSTDADIIIEYDLVCSNNPIQSEPLIVAVNSQTILDNISSDDLRSIASGIVVDNLPYTKIKAPISYQKIVTQIFNNKNSNIEFIEETGDLIEIVAGNKDSIGLIPLSSLTPQVLPLKLDGISVLEETIRYPWQINTCISGQDSAITQDLSESIASIIDSDKTITKVLAVGDIMMGRFVGVKINRSGDPAHPFEYVSDYLSKPDLTFTDLEAPLASDTPFVSDGMILVAQPDTVAGLIKSGIDLVTISSNHFGDALRSGMEDNFKIMEQNDIIYVGAGRTESEAFTPKVVEKNGTKFVFVSFGGIMPDSYGASGDIAGTAWINLEEDSDLDRVGEVIQQAKTMGDIVIACFHWGTEYTPNPTSRQRLYAHHAIDSGADIIVGTHPHVVQANEIYKDKYIIYSLGNFIMDQMWSQETTEGVLIPIYVYNNKIISVDLLPTQIIDYSQVKMLSKEDGKNILQRIWDAGDKLK